MNKKTNSNELLSLSLLDRRRFLKLTSAAAGTAMGCFVLPGWGNTEARTDWVPKKFPKIVLYNFRMFDSTSRTLRENRMLLIEEDRIIGIDPGKAFNWLRDFFMFGYKQVFEALVVGGYKLF